MLPDFQGTNFRDGIEIGRYSDPDLGDYKFIPGRRFTVQLPNFAAATAAQSFWIAPAACKVVRAYERHGTKAGQSGTLQIEKVPSATAIGSGTVLLATAIDLAGDNDTIQNVSALTTAAGTLAAGNMLATKIASGAATSLAAATLTVVLEWV